MIAPCDPHGPSAVVVAGGGGVFFWGDRRKKSLCYFKGLGWVAEIRRRFGKNTEPDPPRRETEGLGEAPPPRLFSSVLCGRQGRDDEGFDLGGRGGGAMDGNRNKSKGMMIIPLDPCGFFGGGSGVSGPNFLSDFRGLRG